MTFSIVGRVGDAYGVAVASKFLAVGAAVPAARVGAGALATQAYANLAYRPAGLDRLAAGADAAAVVDALTGADDGREDRQLGVVGARGAATYTGSRCMTWAGGRSGADYAVQGNILTGPEVVEAMERAWLEGARPDGHGQRLAERLLLALAAGQAAGGDRRGRQSAALLVVSPGAGYGGDDVEVDLRVDDDTDDPVAELGRLLDLHRGYFDAPDPDALLPLQGTTADEVRGLLRSLGHDHPDLDEALDAWAGVENYEMRLRPGAIDPVVLDRLRTSADGAAR